MTRLVRCPVSDCYELMPADSRYCSVHGRKCHTKECDNTIKSGLYCADCKKRHKQLAQRRDLKGDERDNYIIPAVPWTPKPKPKPLMTDAEQKCLDAEVNSRLHARCGYGNGPLKVYTPEERQAIAHTITPLDRIKTSSSYGYGIGF